jgi:hypothetical protein
MENGEITPREKGNRDLTGFLAGAFCVGVLGLGIAGITTVKYANAIKREAKEFVSVLDSSKNGVLETKEVKKFYDVMGLDPYTTPFDGKYVTPDMVHTFLAKSSKRK